MQGHYGTRWLNLWRIGQALPDGQDAGVVNAKFHWAEKLGGFNSPEGGAAIKIVLSSLPADPPSLPVFHDLVRLAFQPAQVARLPHVTTPEEQTEQKQRIAALAQRAKHPAALFTAWYEAILAAPGKCPRISVELAKQAQRNHGKGDGQ